MKKFWRKWNRSFSFDVVDGAAVKNNDNNNNNSSNGHGRHRKRHDDGDDGGDDGHWPPLRHPASGHPWARRYKSESQLYARDEAGHEAPIK